MPTRKRPPAPPAAEVTAAIEEAQALLRDRRLPDDVAQRLQFTLAVMQSPEWRRYRISTATALLELRECTEKARQAANKGCGTT